MGEFPTVSVGLMARYFRARSSRTLLRFYVINTIEALMWTVVRTHASPLARPVEFFLSALSDLRRSRQLATEIAKRDMRRQYYYSPLGAVGVLVFPLLLTALALGFHRSGILAVDSPAVPYALYVLVGVVLWTTFIEALNVPLFGLLSELRLLARTTAPPEAIILGKLGSVVMNLLLKLALIAGAFLWYRIPLPPAAAFAPVGLLGLVLLGAAIGLLIAPLNFIYRDFTWVFGAASTVWFFFSPVYFPTPATGAVSVIMNLNPVTPLLTDTRSLLLTGTVVTPIHSILVAIGAVPILMAAWFCTRIVLSVAMEQVNE
jgi:lipopolysaccharide transport system permease protein